MGFLNLPVSGTNSIVKLGLDKKADSVRDWKCVFFHPLVFAERVDIPSFCSLCNIIGLLSSSLCYVN